MIENRWNWTRLDARQAWRTRGWHVVVAWIVLVSLATAAEQGVAELKNESPPSTAAHGSEDFVEVAAENLQAEATLDFRTKQVAQWQQTGGDLVLQRVFKAVKQPEAQRTLAEVFKAGCRTLSGALSDVAAEVDRGNNFALLA